MQREDSEYHRRQREILVNGLIDKGITNDHVLHAISKVPRHLFMSPEQEDLAYVDKAYPIGEGQTISQPYTVAYQTQLLHIEPRDKVLEIGTGSGYQAAVLAEMGANVYTIERQKKFFERNKHFDFLQSYENIHFFYGDGYEGLPLFKPFDKILLTAAASEPPPKLLDQLKVSGIMVLPLGEEGKVQQMVRITKLKNGEYVEQTFDQFSFVPMLKGKKE